MRRSRCLPTICRWSSPTVAGERCSPEILLRVGSYAYRASGLVQAILCEVSTAQRWHQSRNIRPQPKATAIFESNGRFAVVTTRSDLPRFASKYGARETVDETK